MTEPTYLHLSSFLRLARGALFTGLFKAVGKRGRRARKVECTQRVLTDGQAHTLQRREGTSTHWAAQQDQAGRGVVLGQEYQASKPGVS